QISVRRPAPEHGPRDGCGGDILTAAALHCHANTVRYRLARMKELLGSPDRTDHELFRDLAVAYMVWMMEEQTYMARSIRTRS
ncbi:MAG: helix-turn-helix domain-containing protein, partial [Eubacterium sp.]|nr:helix-turn-helix domain-containing protein [Eubacterium sp.]